MKHAGPATLALLDDWLARIRRLPGLVERKPGIFYVKSQAYLHVHEDPAGLFADAKLEAKGFVRFAVSTEEERELLLARLAENRGAPSQTPSD